MSTKVLFFLFALFLTGNAVADEYKIAAIVNGEAISSYTLERRLNLAIRSSGLPNTPEVKKKVREQVLEILIDESLKEQEAKKLKLEVTTPEMDEAVADIEKQNHLAPGGFGSFLGQASLPQDSVLAQIYSQIAWKKIVVQKIRPKINVTEAEAQEAAEVLANQSGKKQLELSEIALKIDSPENEPNVKALAIKLVSQLKSGGDFTGIAKQFSSGESADEGGSLGWLTMNQLDKKIAAELDKLESGQISAPIKTDKGYEIFKINKIRSYMIDNDGESEILLKQLILPLAAQASPLEVEDKKLKIANALNKIKDCTSFEKIPDTLKASKVRNYGTLKIKNLAAEIRSIIAGIEVREPSPILRNASGLAVFMVCERKDQEGTEIIPDNGKISDALLGQKIELEARRYMKRLRDEAFIEKRI